MSFSSFHRPFDCLSTCIIISFIVFRSLHSFFILLRHSQGGMLHIYPRSSSSPSSIPLQRLNPPSHASIGVTLCIHHLTHPSPSPLHMHHNSSPPLPAATCTTSIYAQASSCLLLPLSKRFVVRHYPPPPTQ